VVSLNSKADFPAGWCCYLILCADQSYYCGITSNLKTRLRNHASGKGAKHTSHARPLALVWYEAHDSKHTAAAREMQIKCWGNEKKRALAAGELSFGSFGVSVVVPLR